MTSTKIETTTMTALDYTHAAHKQLAHGNEREAAGLLWKAAEATFLALAHKRGIEHNGDLIEIAKTLDANGAVTKRDHRGSFGGASLLRAHAEFEALHPFLDGNGRLGRMLIPMFLWQRHLIRRPMFYISAYLEANRDAYYEKLLAVSRDSDWTGWCRFFLKAIQAQAHDNLTKTQGILDLYAELKHRVASVTRSRYAIQALDWIFSQPVFRSAGFADSAGIPRPSAHRVLAQLTRAKILRVILPSSGNQSAILSFPDLLEIVDGDES